MTTFFHEKIVLVSYSLSRAAPLKKNLTFLTRHVYCSTSGNPEGQDKSGSGLRFCNSQSLPPWYCFLIASTGLAVSRFSRIFSFAASCSTLRRPASLVKLFFQSKALVNT